MNFSSSLKDDSVREKTSISHREEISRLSEIAPVLQKHLENFSSENILHLPNLQGSARRLLTTQE